MADIENVDAQPDISEKRVRTLTEKGLESFRSTCASHNEKLLRSHDKIQQLQERAVSTHFDNVIAVNALITRIQEETEHFRLLATDFRDFLNRTNTLESKEELERFERSEHEDNRKTGEVLNHLASIKSVVTDMAKSEKGSCSSHGSGSKASSKLSAVIALKRAKAEAARAKLEFAEQEANLKKQQAMLVEQEKLSNATVVRKKAELEADLSLLAQKSEAAAAVAEAQVLESMEEDIEDKSPLFEAPERGQSLRAMDTRERTLDYVTQQNELRSMHPSQQDFDIKSEFATAIEGDPSTHFPHFPKKEMPFHPYPNENHQNLTREFKTLEIHEGRDNMTMANEITRFLIKKDLLLSRLTSFTDRPESYAVWKNSFKSIMVELSCTSSEELDLLVKWLGPESKKYAVSIRSSNPNSTSRGLKRLWERLDERYGSPEMVEAALKTKLTNFPRLTAKDSEKLYDLADILAEIESVKEDKTYSSLLAYYDTSSGIKPIVNKLPSQIQEKWTSRAVNYKRKHDVPFPPFSIFAEFVRDMSKIKNDPSFSYDSQPGDTRANRHESQRLHPIVNTRKTEVENTDAGLEKICPLHKTRHSLNSCRVFRSKPIEERWKFIKEHRLCFRCCESDQHVKRTCKEEVKCADCGSSTHSTALHSAGIEAEGPFVAHGGETDSSGPVTVSSNCLQICGDGFRGKSCAKNILVRVYPEGYPEKAKIMYAIIDDQSNRSLVRSEFFDLFGIEGETLEYKLSSCSGLSTAYGRRARGFVVESLDRNINYQLPTLIECDQIPGVRDEIPTPEVASLYPHLEDISCQIPPMDSQADMLILIGRDLPEIHHVMDQRIGPRNTPYAQCLPLGWVIIGEACLGGAHRSEYVSAKRTHILACGRASHFKPCEGGFTIKESMKSDCNIGLSVFEKTKDDDKVGLSIEDRKFLDIMENGFQKSSSGKWVAPLPFRDGRQRLPNNRPQALQRARLLDRSLKKNPLKKSHLIAFMEKVIKNGHAEIAPPLRENEECWYLPIFGVYHPKKPDQIRGVFDSSATYEGLSLNNVLLSGPNMTNSLLGILLAFRKEAVAVTVDIEQMFYCFLVKEDHRNFLRFLWYRNNNPDEDLIEYRMTAHVFGNSPSPAVATYGLRKTAEEGEQQFGNDVKHFINDNFYVDDGLISLSTPKAAIDLVKRAQEACRQGGNLHLHKLASNSEEVMLAFPEEDLAKDLKGLDFAEDDLPVQRSLGLSWDLKSDTFTFQVSDDNKPYTRRGVLSVVNSLFDPLGFVAPVTIQGKLFLRLFVTGTGDWDEPLPEKHRAEWENWRGSLQKLKQLNIPRTYSTVSLSEVSEKCVHVFSDASEKAIAAVAYLVTTFGDGCKQIGFILGKAKVAPVHGHTIPRLELCAAVLAVEVAEIVADYLDVSTEEMMFHTDSRVVLGYIRNQSRRFYVYVTNRVERIRKVTHPSQWSYVPTDKNPADSATRGEAAPRMQESQWLVGPSHLIKDEPAVQVTDQSERLSFPLVTPEDDDEIRPVVKVLKSDINSSSSLGCHRFERFSDWRKLVEAVALLRHVSSCHKEKGCSSWHVCQTYKTVENFQQAESVIIKAVQQEQFERELACLKNGKPLGKNCPILSLNPFIDDEGILRVGGRIGKAGVTNHEKHPAILPKNNHVSSLLAQHHHNSVKHQGRHFTEGAVRAAGIWIIGGKRLISSLIQNCVKCKKLRGRQMSQEMSELPADRVQPGPPFTSVGVDTFGPWPVVARRTRGGHANSKRWAILFTCLTTRAIHIEVVEELSSSAFINALRRFIAIRGKVNIFRSDRGTNFVGATHTMRIDTINVEDGRLKSFLYNHGSVWIFNPPHASHMGGAWERMIGVSRRILDSMLTDCSTNLTHDVLVTLMAEVCAIVNSRPLVPVSSDPDCPQVLSPNALLTQKIDCGSQPPAPSDMQNLHKAQWKYVQSLADRFWGRWRREYLQTLQKRVKWHERKPNLKSGDVVLLRDDEQHRNFWPMGIIVNAIKSADGLVRKAEVRVIKEGKPVIYTRPISQLVSLISENSP